MPHEKIDHKHRRDGLTVFWDVAPHGGVVINARTWASGSLVSINVDVDDDDIDAVIAALRKAKRKTQLGQVTSWAEVPDGPVKIRVNPDTKAFKAELDSKAVLRAAQEIAARGL